MRIHEAAGGPEGMHIVRSRDDEGGTVWRRDGEKAPPRATNLRPTPSPHNPFPARVRAYHKRLTAADREQARRKYGSVISDSILDRYQVGTGQLGGQSTLTMPECNADEVPVGVVHRLRSGTEKRVERGSERAMTQPFERPAQVRRVFVAEGGSCTLNVAGIFEADLDDDTAVIGRASKSAGLRQTADYIVKRLRPQEVVLIGDADDTDESGVQQLAEMIAASGIEVRVIYPPDEYKDAREWINAGGTREDFEAAIADAETVQPARRERFLPICGTEIEQGKPPTWLVDGLIPAGSFSVAYGPAGTGKTFVGIGLGFGISAGVAFFGHEVQSGPVAYIATEGQGGLSGRTQAASYGLQKRGYAVTAANLWFICEAPQLLIESDLEALIAALLTMNPRPVLVVIDTLARTLVGGDENSSQDVGRFVAACDRIRQRLGCAVLVIHHTGKTGTIERGSSALRGAADVMLKIADAGARRLRLSCDKMKDSEPFAPMDLALVPIEFKTGASSCYLIEAGAAPTSANIGQAENIRRVTAALTTSANPLGRRFGDLPKATRLSERTCRRVIQHLENESKVVSKRVGKEVYWRVADDAE